MKHIRLFIIIIAACMLSNCAKSVGSIDKGKGGGAGVSFDALWLVPNRLLYDVGESFVCSEDVRIFVAENGTVKEISPLHKEVKVEVIIINPGLVDSETPIVIDNSNENTAVYRFALPGRNKIRVTYNDMSDFYNIEVRGYYDEGGDGSDFFDIIWL